MKLLKKAICITAVAFLLTACAGTKDVQYIQDMTPDTVEFTKQNPGLLIEADDLLSIIVTTKNPELGTLFNLQPGTVNTDLPGLQQNSTGNATIQRRETGYRVDSEGYITFPVLGSLHVAGLTRVQLSNIIKQRIIKEGLLTDFSVSVTFLNAKVSIIGDIARPGNYDFKDDKYTILQAIAEAGDLNITAERNILVMREKNGERKLYEVDLKSRNLFDSPAYYLQQNDVIYVVPNDVKAAQRDLNTNAWRQISTWISLLSFIGSMASIIVTITTK